MFSIFKPYIFSLDPEIAHDLAIKSLKFNILPKSIFKVEDEEILMDIWHKMYPMSRECYRVSKSPGEEIGNPASIISTPSSSKTLEI